MSRRCSNSKPAERRELIEEAAGLGRFKRRRHRAELKLARVAVQVDRARDLEDEVKKRLRPLALQATAAERAEKLGVEISRLQAAIATLDLARLAERRADAERRRATTADERRALDEKIAALVAEREHAEEELTDSAGAREQATAALYRLRSGGERIQLRRESAASFASRRCAPTLLRRGHTTRARRPSSSRLRASPLPPPSPRRASARGCRSRRKSGGRASRRSSGSRRPLAAASSTTCSRGAPRPSRCLPAAVATPCSRSAARRSASACGTSRRSGCSQSCASELGEAQRTPARPVAAELGRVADEADAAARTALREREDLDARVRARARAAHGAGAVARRARRIAACRTCARRAG